MLKDLACLAALGCRGAVARDVGSTPGCPPIGIEGWTSMPIVLALEQSFELAMWVELAVYLPFIVLLTLALLPRCKGIILAVMWATKAEGSEKI